MNNTGSDGRGKFLRIITQPCNAAESLDLNVGTRRKIKVAYVLSHPIQYFVPLFRRLAEREEIELTVIYATDAGAREYYDPGFSRTVTWNVDPYSGYCSQVLAPGKRIGAGFFNTGMTSAARLVSGSLADIAIIHGWGTYYNLSATLSALLTRVPVLYRTDTNPFADPGAPLAQNIVRRILKKYRPLLLSQLFQRLDGILAIGKLNRDFYLGMGVAPDKIHLVPYSIDDALYCPAKVSVADRMEKEAELGFSPGSFRIVFCGKLIARKRPADIIEAVAEVRGKEGIEVIFLGDGELLPELRELANARGVRAYFPGFVNQLELPLFYSMGSVFCLPSEHEPWGLVVNEAMAMGLPAAVSDRVGCGPDLVVPGRTGYVFPVGDTRALAAIIGRVSRSPSLLGELRAGTREMAASYTMSATVDGYVRAILAVAGRV